MDQTTSVKPTSEPDFGFVAMRCLSELIALVAHDLSNPLQSLSVLLELSVDDPQIGGDPAHNIHQALQAVDELRVLIRGLGDFSQFAQLNPEDRTLAETIDRYIALLSRRFQRQKIKVICDLGCFHDQPVPSGEFDLALINLLLAVVAGVTKSRFSSHRLLLNCHPVDSDGRHSDPSMIRVVIQLSGFDANDVATPTIAIPKNHVSRLFGMLHTVRIEQLDHAPDRVSIEFKPLKS